MKKHLLRSATRAALSQLLPAVALRGNCLGKASKDMTKTLDAVRSRENSINGAAGRRERHRIMELLLGLARGLQQALLRAAFGVCLLALHATPAQAAIAFVQSSQSLGNNSQSNDVVVGDVDGDGDLEAVVANVTGANQVWINQGGAAGFVESGKALEFRSATSVALGDLDGDGDLDAFLITDLENSFNQVWFNPAGTSGLFNFSGQAFGDSHSTAVALGDLDGDGDLDAFIVRDRARPTKVWLNSGVGQFMDSGQNLGADSANAVALGDLDGDGDLDAFVATSSTGKVWVNQGGDQRSKALRECNRQRKDRKANERRNDERDTHRKRACHPSTHQQSLPAGVWQAR